MDVIKDILAKFESMRYLPLAVYKADCKFYLLYQDSYTTNQEYFDRFRNVHELLDLYDAIFSEPHACIVDNILLEDEFKRETFTDSQLDNKETTTKEIYLTISMLIDVDCRCY